MTEPKIVIIGAGPTGLGAGYRLQELGHEDWVILEATTTSAAWPRRSPTRPASPTTSVAT
jgi:cation diffusion facilitator CzcD-associated flavoprotein CzcO